jgi:hypothetical protein
MYKTVVFCLSLKEAGRLRDLANEGSAIARGPQPTGIVPVLNENG